MCVSVCVLRGGKGIHFFKLHFKIFSPETSLFFSLDEEEMLQVFPQF